MSTHIRKRQTAKKIKKIYNYIFYRTYLISLKYYSINAISRTASYLSIFIFLNILTLSSFINYEFTSEYIEIIIGIAAITSLLNLKFLNEINTKLIINETENLKVKNLWNVLIDFYAEISILLFMISLGAELNIIIFFLALILIYRIVIFIIKM